MESQPLYKIPTIDLSAKSLLTLSQLTFFAVFTYFTSEGLESLVDYIFPAMMVISGLVLFFSVPNARMGVTLGIPAVMVIMGIVEGESEMIFWAIFMTAMFGPIAYLPALASGDPTLGLEDDVRMKRLGITWLILALLMFVMMSAILPFAMEGEFTEEDFDGTEYTMTLDSTQQMIAQVAAVLGALGIVLFILTAMVGTKVGSLLPWHAGAMVAGALVLGQYLWLVAEGGQPFDFMEIGFIIALVGLIALPTCVGYKESTPPDSE